MSQELQSSMKALERKLQELDAQPEPDEWHQQTSEMLRRMLRMLRRAQDDPEWLRSIPLPDVEGAYARYAVEHSDLFEEAMMRSVRHEKENPQL